MTDLVQRLRSVSLGDDSPAQVRALLNLAAAEIARLTRARDAARDLGQKMCDERDALRERIARGTKAYMEEGELPHSLVLYPRRPDYPGKPVIVIDDHGARDEPK